MVEVNGVTPLIGQRGKPTLLNAFHSRDVTFAVLCKGPYGESARYRDFMGWETPWRSVEGASLKTLLAGRPLSMMYIVIGCST